MTETPVVAKTKRKSAVEVLYNGRTEQFHYRADEKVKALLEKALERFGVVHNPHLMSLFDAEGSELPDAETLAHAGVEPGDELILRQSSVKGG